MKLTSLFIDRPVLSIVLNFTIVLFGLITASLLGVRDYPAVDPPFITVSTSYTGANADVVENKITEPSGAIHKWYQWYKNTYFIK